MLKALIFDVDGTLADTEETHRLAFNAAFAELGLPWQWTPPLYATLLRVSGGKERLRHYIDTIAVGRVARERLQHMVPSLHSTKTRIYSELVAAGKCAFRPGVLALLQAAHAAGIKLAIASTTTLANVTALLNANPRIAFDVIACGDEVKHKKPAPDIFNLALARLRCPARACVAFEDSLNGLRAAKDAGVATVVTPSSWTIGENFAAADLVLPSLEGLDLARLDKLLGEAHAAA